MAATSVGKGRGEGRTGSYHCRGESTSSPGTTQCDLGAKWTEFSLYIHYKDRIISYFKANLDINEQKLKFICTS